jgi:hypothetical protein
MKVEINSADGPSLLILNDNLRPGASKIVRKEHLKSYAVRVYNCPSFKLSPTVGLRSCCKKWYPQLTAHLPHIVCRHETTPGQKLVVFFLPLFMDNLLPLPIPSESWLHSLNERYRRQDMPPAERPIRAMEEWAVLQGQPGDFGRLALSHLGGEAWKTIDAFFCLHTKLGRERIQPLSRSVWFYDVSFYEVKLFVILGGTGPVSTINPFKCLEETMPKPLLWAFSPDEPKVQEYLEHLSNALDSFVYSDAITQNLKEPLAREFLGAAATHLDSTVTGLLDTHPNPQAVGHARLAFETSLKALSAEKEGLTKEEAKKTISHRLDRLFDTRIIHCAHLIPAADFARLENAAQDSAKTQCLFPRHDAHYDSVKFPRRRLWECYTTAQHAFATVLRALGASDSRKL